MPEPMMQPQMWAPAVPEPNYASALLTFQPPRAAAQTQQKKPAQAPQAGASPMDAMAKTANGVPLAAALMRMFGGGTSGQAPVAAMPQGVQPMNILPVSAGNTGAPALFNPHTLY